MTVEERVGKDIIANQEKLRQERLKHISRRHGYSERQIRRMANDPQHIREVMRDIAEIRRYDDN